MTEILDGTITPKAKSMEFVQSVGMYTIERYAYLCIITCVYVFMLIYIIWSLFKS
jgi:hypothetical protein